VNPYRTACPPTTTEREPTSRGDDGIVAGVLAAVGALRVAIAVAGGERFGAEATAAALMLVIGLVGLVAAYAENR
jgi:hypothetical protein